MKKKITALFLAVAMALTLFACGAPAESQEAEAITTNGESSISTTNTEDNTVIDTVSFKVSDFIAESDDRMTTAMGGRAKELTSIPDFPDAGKHFYPSTDNYCLICAPAYTYLETMDSKQKIARFDLISFDADGLAQTHYQALVFDSTAEAEKYHEFRKNRDGVEYRELYAGSNLTDDMMVGCAKRYENIIYFNVGFDTVGMEEVYNKSYLAGEQSFYEGIGYSYLYSVDDCTSDPYGHYVWTAEDNDYFYPTSHRFSITKEYINRDPDGVFGEKSYTYILYTLYNYNEYGDLYSKSSKIEFENEEQLDYMLKNPESDYFAETNVNLCLKTVGSTVYDYKNMSATGQESGIYYTLLGEEYMERDSDYDDGSYPAAGFGLYYYFSLRDKEYPTEVEPSQVAAVAEIEVPGEKEPKPDTDGTGSWEAYFCTEEIDETLNKPCCEIFVQKDGDEAKLHLYEYVDGEVKCEVRMIGDFDEMFETEAVSLLPVTTASEPYENLGECTITMIDHDNMVVFADMDISMLDYLLHRAEHTVTD